MALENDSLSLDSVCVCIVGDKLPKDATPALFQDVVNPLAAWLLKRR